MASHLAEAANRADVVFERDTEMTFASEAQSRLEAEHLERDACWWRMLEELGEVEREQDEENLQLNWRHVCGYLRDLEHKCPLDQIGIRIAEEEDEYVPE